MISKDITHPRTSHQYDPGPNTAKHEHEYEHEHKREHEPERKHKHEQHEHERTERGIKQKKKLLIMLEKWYESV